MPLLPFVRPSSVVLSLALVQLAFSAFYLPNGTDVSPIQQFAERCSFDPSNPLYNTVCHLKWKNPPGNDTRYSPTQDECMPNGLCQNRGYSSKPGDEHPPWTDYYRVYCADQTWKGCLDVCSTGVSFSLCADFRGEARQGWEPIGAGMQGIKLTKHREMRMAS